MLLPWSLVSKVSWSRTAWTFCFLAILRTSHPRWWKDRMLICQMFRFVLLWNLGPGFWFNTLFCEILPVPLEALLLFLGLTYLGSDWLHGFWKGAGIFWGLLQRWCSRLLRPPPCERQWDLPCCFRQRLLCSFQHLIVMLSVGGLFYVVLIAWPSLRRNHLFLLAVRRSIALLWPVFVFELVTSLPTSVLFLCCEWRGHNCKLWPWPWYLCWGMWCRAILFVGKHLWGQSSVCGLMCGRGLVLWPALLACELSGCCSVGLVMELVEA